jgi:hypothetical protein
VPHPNVVLFDVRVGDVKLPIGGELARHGVGVGERTQPGELTVPGALDKNEGPDVVSVEGPPMAAVMALLMV